MFIYIYVCMYICIYIYMYKRPGDAAGDAGGGGGAVRACQRPPGRTECEFQVSGVGLRATQEIIIWRTFARTQLMNHLATC